MLIAGIFQPNIILGYFGPWEIGILLLLVVLLFGRKLPEVMKGLGQGLKEFKKASNEGAENDNDNSNSNDNNNNEKGNDVDAEQPKEKNKANQ